MISPTCSYLYLFRRCSPPLRPVRSRSPLSNYLAHPQVAAAHCLGKSSTVCTSCPAPSRGLVNWVWRWRKTRKTRKTIGVRKLSWFEDIVPLPYWPPRFARVRLTHSLRPANPWSCRGLGQSLKGRTRRLGRPVSSELRTPAASLGGGGGGASCLHASAGLPLGGNALCLVTNYLMHVINLPIRRY